MANTCERFLLRLLLCGFVVSLQAIPAAAQGKPDTARGGQHDFDFEFGSWKAQLSRLLKPLTGSTTWVNYEGTSVVRKVWNGRANLGELDVSGPGGHITGLTLRLYNPESRQWHISWANSNDGLIGTPMVGEFKNGRGVFYDQETFDGRAIFVRFIFSDITQTSFHFEQAFSADGGVSWEVNWKARFERTREQE